MSVAGRELTFRSFADIPVRAAHWPMQATCSGCSQLYRNCSFFLVIQDLYDTGGGLQCGGETTQDKMRCLNGRFVQLV